jgi:hypothetical protein
VQLLASVAPADVPAGVLAGDALDDVATHAFPGQSQASIRTAPEVPSRTGRARRRNQQLQPDLWAGHVGGGTPGRRTPADA